MPVHAAQRTAVLVASAPAVKPCTVAATKSTKLDRCT
jgi:hypothetical protein